MGPLATNFSDIFIGFKYCHSRKCTWKCRLRNGVHFVSASMCKYRLPALTIICRYRRNQSFRKCYATPATVVWWNIVYAFRPHKCLAFPLSNLDMNRHYAVLQCLCHFVKYKRTVKFVCVKGRSDRCALHFIATASKLMAHASSSFSAILFIITGLPTLLPGQWSMQLPTL